MFTGVRLSKLISSHNYAYKLSLTSPQTENQQTKISSGLHIYKPYFQGYQDWRDNALKKADEILDSHKNVTIVSLDITRYFYHVRLNLPEFVEKNYWEKIPLYFQMRMNEHFRRGLQYYYRECMKHTQKV